MCPDETKSPRTRPPHTAGPPYPALLGLENGSCFLDTAFSATLGQMLGAIWGMWAYKTPFLRGIPVIVLGILTASAEMDAADHRDVLVLDTARSASGQMEGRVNLIVGMSVSSGDRVPLHVRPRLPASLLEQEPGLSVDRTFRIGSSTIFVVSVTRLRVEGFKRAVLQVDGVFLLDADQRRHIAKLNDPHYSSSGLWGQSFDNQWGIKRVGFTDDDISAWTRAGTDLEPVIVAVIDSGLDWYHPDISREAIWRNPMEAPENQTDDDANGYVDDIIGWNFIDNNNMPWDYDGHGTFVAGVIAASQNNGVGIAGINPAARIMVLKALDAFGRGYASMIAEAIAYAADNGARVINLSLGGRELTKIEQLAVDHAHSKGAVVVVAAGNAAGAVAGYSPGGLKGVITVAATDRRDRRAGFSNWGPPIDIAAPGVDILSLRARNTDLLSYIRDVKYEIGQGIVGTDRAYYRASGTSFAAPIVSGTVSLIWSMSPELSADDVKRMVLNSARDIETPGVDNYTGYGLLDATAALAADPQFYVESRILGVKVIQINGQTALRILGSSDANRFGKASIFLGKGRAPSKWSQVNVDIGEPVNNGTLADLPAGLFKGDTQWTIRLVTVHENGFKREARFQLTLE